MSLKQNIVFALNGSRRMLDGLIESLNKPEDWLHQPCPKANHPLWVVGHLGLADNMFLSRLGEEDGKKPEGWDELFWMGSEVYSDASKYPPVEEVLAYCRERRAALLAKVDALPDEFFTQPAPAEGMFAEAPNMASILLFAAYHEGVHSGQFTIAHRSLGHEPLFQPKPANT